MADDHPLTFPPLFEQVPCKPLCCTAKVVKRIVLRDHAAPAICAKADLVHHKNSSSGIITMGHYKVELQDFQNLGVLLPPLRVFRMFAQSSASQFLADCKSSKYFKGWPVSAVSKSASLRFMPVTPSTAVFCTYTFVAAEAVFMTESRSLPTL